MIDRVLRRHVSMIADQLLNHEHVDVVLVGDEMRIIGHEDDAEYLDSIVEAIEPIGVLLAGELLERDRIVSAKLAGALGNDHPAARRWGPR